MEIYKDKIHEGDVFINWAKKQSKDTLIGIIIGLSNQ